MDNATHNTSSADLEVDGMSPGEVFQVTFFVPICSLLIRMLVGLFDLPNRLLQVVEVALLNVILLLALTLLENNHSNTLLNLVYLLPVLIAIKVKKDATFDGVRNTETRNFSYDFVGGYRGHLLLATNICILAVDFNFFHERFAKTLTYGWSVMDAGVGSFVLLHGLCSSHGKYFNSEQHGLKKAVLSSYPLILMGLIRFIATTAVGYHKVVSEYGLHWNFFFTLAFTKMTCSSILCMTRIPAGVLAAFTSLFHQYLLSGAGMTDFVLNGEERETFLQANKEGICSLPGFMCLYFCGVQLGRTVWKQRSGTWDYVRLLLKLCAVGACAWLLMEFLFEYVQPVSRRLANLPYCVWVVSLTILQIAVHLCQDIFLSILNKTLKINYSNPYLWEIINYNGLFYFLFANLLTGLVNITISTKDCSDTQSFLILILYLFILTGASALLHIFSIQLKFR